MDLKEENILGDNVKAHWYYRAKLAALQRAIADIPPVHVLDVGAGSGFFARGLIVAGRAISATCVDPGYLDEHDELVGSVPLRFRRGLDGQLPNISLTLMMDVLEHVPDDIALVREYVDQIPSGSRVLVTVPAFRWLWSGHDVFLEHYRRYTLPEVEKVLRAAGLRIEFGNYFYGAVLPVAVMFRFGRKIFGDHGTQAKSDMRLFNPLLNWLFWTACRFELPFAKRNRAAGLSVFVRAVKP